MVNPEKINKLYSHKCICDSKLEGRRIYMSSLPMDYLLLCIQEKVE